MLCNAGTVAIVTPPTFTLPPKRASIESRGSPPFAFSLLAKNGGISLPVTILAFFATPLVYPVSMVPEAYRLLFELNPLHALIACWRSVLLGGELPWSYFGYAAGTAAAMGLIAWALYRRFGTRVGELI